MKFVPVTTTAAPTAPLVGLKPEIVGGARIVNALAELAVPTDVVTLITPLLVPGATVAVT